MTNISGLFHSIAPLLLPQLTPTALGASIVNRVQVGKRSDPVLPPCGTKAFTSNFPEPSVVTRGTWGAWDQPAGRERVLPGPFGGDRRATIKTGVLIQLWKTRRDHFQSWKPARPHWKISTVEIRAGEPVLGRAFGHPPRKLTSRRRQQCWRRPVVP